MKAAILHKNGDPTDASVLSVKDDVPIPKPGKDEIVIKVMSAAINPVDYKLAKAEFPGKSSGGMGCDVAGIVHEVGADVVEFEEGHEVYADAIASVLAKGDESSGSWAEYCKIQKVAAAHKPTNCSFQEAAALPLAGLTALQGLETQGGFQKGMKVAILGASGGVGSLAVQMAKAMGASLVIGTGSSVDMIKDLGADEVINYKETSVAEALKGKDLDIVYDTIGGYDSWVAAQAGLKKGGTFVTIVGDGGGFLSMLPGIFYRKFMWYFGGPVYKIFLTNTKAPEVVNDMKKITELVESGKVKPVLDKASFELTTESVHEMIKASMSHRAKGKLVLTVHS